MKKILLSIAHRGLMSSSSGLFQYSITFSDAGEPLPSPGASGFGTADYDDMLHTLSSTATFSGLHGNHVCMPTFTRRRPRQEPVSAGVATTTPSLAGFPLGVTSGSYSNTLDLTMASSWNGAYVTANGERRGRGDGIRDGDG